MYRVEISDEKYRNVKAALEEHIKHAHNCRFSYLGLILCYMRIKISLKNRYFCSQFVSEILETTDAVPLDKHSSLYLPDDFTRMKGLELCFSGSLSELVNPQTSLALSFA